MAPLDEDMLDADLREARLRRQNEKLLQMINWVQSDQCRMRLIYEYFGEGRDQVAGEGRELYACGVCDNCRAKIGAMSNA